MSRIGQQPITIPSGVDVTIDGARVAVKGPKGELEHTLVGGVSVSRSDDVLSVERVDDTRSNRSLHGLQRRSSPTWDRCLRRGSPGSSRSRGGYRAQAQGPEKIEIAVGYSHPVHVQAPAGVTFEVPQPTRIVVRGFDKQLVGQVAADIRKLRKPEPYKGKGIRYAGERVQRKAGKSAK
jgi:large subunit ribosomal protein L6